VPKFRRMSGIDDAVAQFMSSHPVTLDTMVRFTTLLKFLLPLFVLEGKSYLTVSIGCTGGRHRSVYVAEALRKSLGPVEGARVHVRHRDMGLGS